MTLQLLTNRIFGVKTSRFCHLLHNFIMDFYCYSTNLLTTSGLSILLHDVISLPEAMSCDKKASSSDNFADHTFH